MTRYRMKHRSRAFTLIEVLVAVTLGSTIMLLAVILANRAMNVMQQASDAQRRSTTMHQLLNVVRSDVQWAHEAASNGPDQLSLDLEGHRVSYQIQAEALERVVQDGERVLSTQQLPLLATKLDFQLLNSPSRVLITMRDSSLPIASENASLPSVGRSVAIAYGIYPEGAAVIAPESESGR